MPRETRRPLPSPRLAALGLLLAALSSARAEPPQAPESLESLVERVVTAQLAAHHIPGATVVVVHEGRGVLRRGYGLADAAREVPVEGERTLFRVASVGKVFIWTVVMRLVEQGRLDLDADVRPLLDAELQRAWADAPPLTLAHLMAHTGGFAVPERLWPAGPPLDSLEDFLHQRRPPRVRPPGMLSAYSDYGTALAQHLVERVTGQPFEAVLREQLLEPLGLRRTWYGRTVPPELAADLARGHTLVGGTLRPQALEEVEVASGGSLMTTAADMERFLRAHLQGGQLDGQRVLGEETVARMHRQHFTHEPRLAGWAHGFMEFHLQGQRLLGHTGDAYLFTSLLALSPERGWGLFVSYNGLGEKNAAQEARMELLRAVLAHDFPASPAAPPAPAPSGPSGRFAGGYQTTWRTYDTAEASLGWKQEVHVFDAGPGVLRLWRPGRGLRRWVEVAPRLFRPETPADSPERLAFREDATGHVTHLFLENRPLEAFERVPWYDTAPVTHGLLATCALLFALAVGAGLVHRTPDTALPAALGLLHLLFLAGLTVLVRQRGPFAPGDLPALVGASRTFALAAVGLTPGALWLLARPGRGRPSGSRPALAVFCMAAGLFALWLHHWHWLGGT